MHSTFRGRLAAGFCALLVAGQAFADPVLLLVPSLGTPDSVTVHGRVLASAPTRGSSTLSRNLRRLASTGLEGQTVQAELMDVRGSGRSVEDGAFSFGLKPPEGRSFPKGIQAVRVKSAGASAEVAVSIVANEAPFIVVSDVDDTVLVSNVTQPGLLVKSALFQDSDTHPAVPGMAAFYRCLRDGSKVAPGFAFVSGSPVQFAPRLQTLFKRNGFPFGGLYLRDFSLKTLSGYKQPKLRSLLQTFSQKFVLIGDAGEKDPEIYAEMRKEFPDRIARIYIRQVRPKENQARFEGMFLFKDARTAALDAASNGLLEKSCVDRELPPPPP